MNCISYISKRYYLGIIYTHFPHFIVILQNNLIQIEYVWDGFEINVPDIFKKKSLFGALMPGAEAERPGISSARP